MPEQPVFPIIIRYESDTEDVVEITVRAFQQGRAFRVGKWRGAVVCALIFGFFGILGFHANANLSLPVVCIVAGAWGAYMFTYVYPNLVRRRITACVKSELQKGSVAQPTAAILSQDELVYTYAANRSVFPLDELDSVGEDARYLTLSFGARGSCLIPLRAFVTESARTEFMQALEHARARKRAGGAV